CIFLFTTLFRSDESLFRHPSFLSSYEGSGQLPTDLVVVGMKRHRYKMMGITFILLRVFDGALENGAIDRETLQIIMQVLNKTELRERDNDTRANRQAVYKRLQN